MERVPIKLNWDEIIQANYFLHNKIKEQEELVKTIEDKYEEVFNENDEYFHQVDKLQGQVEDLQDDISKYEDTIACIGDLFEKLFLMLYGFKYLRELETLEDFERLYNDIINKLTTRS